MNTNKWKQSGRVYLWRYDDNPKNYRGWHLTADSKGVRSLLKLIELMLKSVDEAKRTIKMDRPTENELKVTNCKSKAIPSAKMIFLNKKDSKNKWKISDDQGTATLEADDESLCKLRDGLADIQNGRGDYFIGTKGQELWFWWHLDC